MSDTNTEQLWAPDFENGLLGTMISNPAEAIPLALKHGFRPALFYSPVNQSLASSAIALYSDKKTLDLLTFTEFLRGEGDLERVGGPGVVTRLYLAPASVLMVPHYVDGVKEKYALREVSALMTETKAQIHGGGVSAAELLLDLRKKVHWIEGVAPGWNRLPALVDVAGFTGENLPQPPPQIVEGLLHRGSKLILGGTSKGRKTFSLLDLGISVATGCNWWGFKCRPGRVCYINFEIQAPFFARRFESICRAKGVTYRGGSFEVWNLRGYASAIENLIDDLLERLARGGFDLVILDPIYKALGDRDENKAGDVASLMNQLERVTVETGAAIAFAAHFSKGNQTGKESMDRIGGSGVFGRDADSILTLTPHSEIDCLTVDATLRNFPPSPPFVLRWLGNDPTMDNATIFTRDDNLDPEDLKGRKTGKPAPSPTGVLSDALVALVQPGESIPKTVLCERAHSQGLAGKRLGINRIKGLVDQVMHEKKLVLATHSNGKTILVTRPL